MPYINKNRRVDLDADVPPNTAGELNYVITRIITAYARRDGKLSYSNINDILGALEGAKLEFYRRVAVPYENGKMVTNGDVYSE